jgi:hypothetical protein
VKLTASGQSGQITTALVDVALGVKVTFSDKDQVVLRATGVRYEQVRDQRKMGQSIIDAFWNKNVDYDDYFVTGIITAESGAAAVSGEKGATLELTGKGDVTPGASVSLGNLKAGIDIASSSKTTLQVPMKNGFVIAIRLVQLVKDGVIFVKPKVVDRDALLAEAPDFVIMFDEAKRAGG